MAIVDIPGRDPLSVPDSWGQDEVTDFVRKSYPDLFEPAVVEAGPSPIRLGPDRAPLSPEERQARIDSIRGTPEDNRRFQAEQFRIADLAALAADREAGGLRGLLASQVMEGPRRVAAGLADLLKIPGTFLDTQVVTPLLMTEATRPAGERIARLVSEFSKGVEGAQEQLRVSDRPDTGLSLRDVARTAREVGPAAAAADLGTMGVEAIADSAAYILPQGLIARGFRSLGLAPKAANFLGSVAAVAPIETAQALSEYTEAGANPVAARFVAPMVGLINGALESITDSAVLSRLGGGDAAKKGAVKFLVGQVLGEGVTEGLQEGATIGGRTLLTGDPGPDALNRLGTSTVAGMLAGGGLGGAVELANRITAPPALDARGVPVDVAPAPVASGPVVTGSAPIPSAPVPVGTGAVQDYVPLGKRKRKAALAFADVAAQEGVAELVDFVPEAKRTPQGVPIEAEFSGGRMRVYTPNISGVSRLRSVLREEKAHGWIASDQGQVALSEFLTANPLTPAEQAKLQKDGYLQAEGEAPEAYLRRLSDEFVAKLNRDPKWKQWVGEAVAWVKKSIGVGLTNTQAGRLMLRNIRGAAPRSSAGVRQSLDPAPGMVRLYRGDTRGRDAKGGVPDWVRDTPEFKATVDASGRWFTTNRAAAEEYRTRFGDGSGGITYIDLPAEEAAKYNIANQPEAAKFTSGGASGPLAREEFFLPRELANQAKPAPTTPRYSLSPDRTNVLLTQIRNQYPSAPNFVISDAPDRRGAYFDGTNIILSPSDLPGNPAAAKSAVVAAMVDAGLNLFPGTFVGDTYDFLRSTDPMGTARIAERMGVDPKTPEGQRVVVTQALRLQAEEGRMRPWLRRWMQRLRLAPTNPLADALTRASKAILAGYEIPEAMLGRRVTPQEQVYADLHAGIWRYAKPIVDRIRDLALDSRFASEDERMFRNMANRMQSLAASGRARDIGSRNTDRIWNPRDAKFIDDLRDAGVPVTDSDARTHEQYRFEAEARALASVLDTLDDLLDLLDRLARTAPAFDRTEDEATLKKLQTRIEKADPDALARAEDLRRSRARKWASKAAAQALLDPQIRAWLEIIERIEETGTVPRDTAEGNLADAQRIVQDTMFLSWRPFRKRTQEVLDEFMAKTYPETLVRLREALEKQQSSRVAAHVAVGEILSAIAGKLGLSGSPEDRATVDFLREDDELLRRFIVALAQASPDDAVAKLRRLLLSPESRSPAEQAELTSAAASVAGVSKDALDRLLSLIEQSPGHRNAVVDAYNAVSKELTQSAIAAIKGIEEATTDEGRKEAVKNATRIMERFVRARGDAVDTLRGIEQEIAQLEARREGLELLRDAGATEVPESELATSEMLYDAADGGVLFRGFTRADGTQQPEIRILPRDEYTGELLVRLMEWQQSAEAAIMTGVNPDPITRGLQVALPLSDFYVDSKFTRDQITSTKAPGKMQDRLSGSPLLAWLNLATRETLSMLVPGVMGRRLRVKLSAYADAGRTIDKMVRRHAAKNHKLMVAAAESLGLDLNNEGDAILLQRARNELAHRLGRQFDADVGVDSLLIELPGRRVTPELVNLLRNDRAIGREAQRAGLNRPYGGTRIELPGERAVRQPGETGTFGLARIAQRSIYQELARVYRTKDPVQIAAFWDSPEARNGLLWHVLDSGRVDLGTERNRELQDAERKVAARIFQGAPVPRTLDEMITALSAESGLTRAETRTRLLSELAEYGKVAMARIPSAEGTAVNTSAISMHGESDLTEFTQAAAPLMFPSSWYTYGLSDSLNGFLERTGDPQQVEYLRAVQEAAESLRSTATAISEALTKPREESAELLAKYKGDILWHTNGIWSGQNISRERADTAVKRMRLRASRLDAEVSELQNPTKNWQSSVQRTIASVIPWMLMWIPTMIKNVASGPWATRLPLRPFIGTGSATALAAASMLGSIPHLAYDRLVAAARAAGVNLETFEEILAYMESSAISGSYSRAELGESEAWARGEVQRPLERVLTQASDTARKIGEYTGTPIGDTTLNRMMIRTTVPISILRLKRIARTWKARLAKAGLDPSQRDDPRTALSDEDLRLGDPAGIRDWLGAIGSPEEILNVIDEVPTRAFWRHPLGVAIGNNVISQVNTATRANRPSASPLLALLGWSSNVLNQLAADARTTPEDSRSSKVSGFAVKQLSWMALSAMAYYWSMILARQANAIQTELAESLQQILLGLDGDDQDEEGLFEALVGMAQMLRKIPGVSPMLDAGARVAGAMKSPPATGESTPLDASFWEQSGKDIAKQTAMAVPKGLGFDIENPRIPAFGILSQLAQGVFQAGSAGLTAAGDPTPEGLAGAKADAKESLRKVLSVFSMAGQFAYNLLVPETVVSKQVKAEVIEAARSVGIEPSKPPLFRGFMSATPKEQALREAARRQDEASLRNIAGFAYKQAYENALAKGKTPEEAASAGEQSVKALLVQLDPVRDAVGGPVSEEQYAKLLPKLGPKVREAVAQKDWAVRVLSERPPEPMRPFAPTEAMETPVRQAPGRRVSFRAPRRVRGRRSRYLRRGRRRRLRVRV